jgi:hypothetical protein
MLMAWLPHWQQHRIVSGFDACGGEASGEDGDGIERPDSR